MQKPLIKQGWFSKVKSLFTQKKSEESNPLQFIQAPKKPALKQERTAASIEVPQRNQNNGNYKLNSDQVMKLCYMIASFEKGPRIVERIQEEFGITITTCTVQYYKNHEVYKKVIMDMREKWNNELSDVELAHKRKRLEEIQKIYERCLDTNQMKNALASLYQIQGEVEKAQNIGTQTNYQINIYKDMTEEELEEERVKSLERLKTLRQISETKTEEKKDAG